MQAPLALGCLRSAAAAPLLPRRWHGLPRRAAAAGAAAPRRQRGCLRVAAIYSNPIGSYDQPDDEDKASGKCAVLLAQRCLQREQCKRAQTHFAAACCASWGAATVLARRRTLALHAAVSHLWPTLPAGRAAPRCVQRSYRILQDEMSSKIKDMKQQLARAEEALQVGGALCACALFVRAAVLLG